MKTSNVFQNLMETLTAGNSQSLMNMDGDSGYVTIRQTKQVKKFDQKHNRRPSQFKEVLLDQAINTLDMIQASIIVFDISSQGIISVDYTAPNLAKFLGTDNEFLENNPDIWVTNIHAYDFAQVFSPTLKKLTDSVLPHQIEYRYLADGELKWIKAHLIPEKKSSESTQVFALLQDISINKKAESVNHNISLLNKSIAQNSSAVVYTYEVSNDQYSFIEDSLTKILPHGQEYSPSNEEEFMQYLHPDDIIKFREYRTNLLKNKQQGCFSGGSLELRFKWNIGSWKKIKVSESITTQNISNAPVIHGIIEDLSKIETLENQLYQQTQFDNLTNLPNRTMFMKKTSDYLSKFHEDSIRTLALLFVNINRFNIINDSLGYANGDKLLSKLGDRLRNAVDENIYISRLGVDEFALLVSGYDDQESLKTLSMKLIKELSRPFEIDQHKIHTTVSIGICEADSNYNSAETLIGNAGSAIQKAKQYRNGGYAFFQSDMHELTYSRFILEGELRHALDNEELELHYQPKYSLIEDTIVGCEALVRWRSKTRGLVNPGDFIPLAEENGMIIDMDTWIINQAFKTLQRWKRRGIICKMSVNISSRFFNEGKPVKLISQALESTGVNPAQVELEITESAIMKDLESSKNLIDQLQSLGIRIAIDDFGTGYSSLAYLKELNVDTLKIDQKFMADLTSDTNSQAIIRSVINLAKLLDLEVVAEGVENLDQVSYLKEHDCDTIQGYLLSKPLEDKQLISFFKNTNFSLIGY